MKKKLMLTMMMAVCFVFVQAQNQTDSYLQDITKVVKELRKSNNTVRNSVVNNLSKDGKPKITLMDEVQLSGDKEEKANEVKGAKGNRFKLNQVVSRVYKKQNHRLQCDLQTDDCCNCFLHCPVLPFWYVLSGS